MKNKWLYRCALITLVLLCLPVTAWAADNPVGVSYRGHIQDLGDYPADGSWVDSPEIIGTVGQSKRIEGFEIKLTGTVPAGMELRYNVHVQNKGWLYDENDPADWPKDGAYAGTRGDSLRIEAVKIVLTDRDGKAIPGYSVQYRGHVQNVGDLPVDKSLWLADGKQLGTVGSSLRLEALLVRVVKTAVEPPAPVSVVYNKTGTFGPATGNETITGDATIAADGVILQNLTIAGNLTISEAVGSGTVTLNNVTVKGDTVVRGGGVHSIKINGGDYSRIIMEKTASGAVRIVAIDVKGLPFFVSEAAAGETIILEGAFESVTVDAPNMNMTTQGNTTTIGKLTVGAGAEGSTVTVAAGTTVSDLVLDGKAAVKGQGTVTKAAVNADGVSFEKAPGQQTVAPTVTVPPVTPPVTPPNPGGGGGGYTPPTPIAVTGVSLNKTALSLSVNTSETLIATVNPAGASNKVVSWFSSDRTVATVGSDGTVTGIAEGTAEIDALTQDGNKYDYCVVTVKDLKATIDGVTVPFAGESPVTTIAATSQYSGTVSWQKKVGSSFTTLTAGEPFDGTSTYLATITLSLDSCYTAADIPADFFTVAGATATNNAGALALTAEFVATEQYRITNDGIITAYSGSGGDLAVLATVNHTAVTGIGENAFKDQAVITAITLPTTVAAIGDAAFAGCTGLTAVTFTAPSALKSIGVSAFDGCTALAKIAIPESVTAIAKGAFESCSKLTAVTFDDAADLNTIGDAAFCNCQLLQSIAIPDSVTSIGLSAFQDCPKLTAITFRGAAPSLGADAIAAGTIIHRYAKETGFNIGAWSSYTKADILAKPELKPPTVTNSGSSVVELEWNSIPGAMGYQVDISEKSDLSAAASVTVTEAKAIISTGLDAGKCYYFAVKAHDGYGESLLSDVKSVAVPYAIPVVSVTLDQTALTVGVSQGVKLTATIAPADATNQEVSWTSNDDSIASVGSDGKVTGVKEGLATITATTQDGKKTATCAVTVKDLKAAIDGVTVPFAGEAPVTTIAATSQYSGTISWQKKVGSSFTTLTAGELFDGTSTYQATITLSLGALYSQADISANFFAVAGATATNEAEALVITAVFVPTNQYKISSVGWITAYSGPGGIITIPAMVNNTAVIAIDQEVFKNQTAITAITFTAPSELKSIGLSAFSGCTALASIAIPQSVTAIYAAAFDGCTSLTAVTFAAGADLKTIGDSAFHNCNQLQSIAIPDQVTAIEASAFGYCQKLNSVSFTPASGLERIDANAFNSCVALTEITIPATVTSLGAAAFNNCAALQKITILGRPTAIELQTFQNCITLEAITIPDSVTSIGASAFQYCSKLTTITFQGAAPSLGPDAIASGTIIRRYANETGFNTGDWAGYPKENI